MERKHSSKFFSTLVFESAVYVDLRKKNLNAISGLLVFRLVSLEGIILFYK